MVGRLIEDQEVCLGEHQLREGNTAALTTGERGDHFENIITGKEEGGEHVSNLCLGKCRVSIGNFLKDRLLRVEYMVFLVIISDLNLGAQGKSS